MLKVKKEEDDDEIEDENKYDDDDDNEIKKDSDQYNYLRKFCNLTLLARDKDKTFHPLLIRNREARQKLANNQTAEFQSVQQSGKDALDSVEKILFVELGLIDVILSDKERKRINEELLSGVINQDAEDLSDKENSFDVVAKARFGGWKRYYILRRNPVVVYDELDGEEEKAEWLKTMKFWQFELANYITNNWPTGDTLQRAVGLGLVPEFCLDLYAANARESVKSSKASRREKLNKLRGYK